MFVQRITKKVKNKTYHSVILRQNYRDTAGKVRHRTILNITKWEEPAIRALEASLKDKPVSSLAELNLEQGKSIGAIFAIKEIAKRLGIIKGLGSGKAGKLALYQIAGRILCQGSRRYLANEWPLLQEIDSVYGSLELDDHCLYENLDWLSENQAHIESKIFKHRWKKDSVKNLFLYDVTSSYLEGEHNELAAYGYNRDKKKGKKQIVIGLMTDNLGYPVSIQVFKGNTSDPQTVLSQLKKLKSLFNVQEVVFVGDKGMIKSQQIEDLENDFKTWGYLTTITKKQIQTLMLNGVFQYRLFDKKMIEVQGPSGIRYILRRNPNRAQDIAKNRKDKIKACMEEMRKKNQYLKDHSRAKPEVAIKNIESFIVKLKLSKILSVTCIKRVLSINTNNSELETASRLDGCYVVKTNVSKEILSTEEAHDRYKDLSLVESSFRKMKTTLEKIRPLFVRKKSRTKGHVFICSLGYMIVKYIQEKTKHLQYSLQFVLSCLDSIHTLKYVWNGRKEMLLPKKYTKAQTEILEALDLKLKL